MTKPPRDGARPEPPRRPARDPYGLLPKGVPIAAAVSIVGLLIIGIVTLNLTSGKLPITPGGGEPQGSDELPARTATPSNEVIVATPPPDTGITVPGTLVYAKAGNIWVQTGKDARQLTTGGQDSMPSWSPDGTMVYFVRTVDGEGRWPSQGVTRTYVLSTPSVMRIKADGSSDKAELVLSGKVKQGNRTWQAWIREPTLSPNGRTLALVSDLPDPTQSDVVLQFYDLQTTKSRVPKLPEAPPLGHQDPEWRPDGR
jgi:dipeptidyl aminopeptidase/acylaminoacyl peptidase